ncbi:L,D-transpeptidase family protein [Methylomagnum sp.]
MTKINSQLAGLVRLVFWVLVLFAAEAWAQEPISDTPSTHIQSLLRDGVNPRLRWGSFPDFQAQLDQLYKQNGLEPLWVKEGYPTAQAVAMIESLAEADDQGLSAADYDAEPLRKWLAAPELVITPTPREIASFDTALSLSAMRYLSNLYLGRVNPRNANFGLSIEPKKVDLPNLVQKIAQSDSPKALVNGMEPTLPVYKSLKEALVRYRALAKDTPALSVSFPPKFGPGGHHKDIPAVRRYLAALGDLPQVAPGAENPEAYDAELVAAMKSFQQRHGLGTDGVIGKGTVAALNVPPAERVKQIQLGLERLRWLPDDVKGLYLFVNIPSFQLYGSRSGEGFGHHDLQMNVIVGEAEDGHNTPIFHSDMTYVTFHPYWNVPPTIAVKELVPALRRNPGYLARNNMEIVSGRGASAGYDGDIADALASGALRIRQKPGEKNALGLVKFTFPNNNNVYLHSTPNKALFQRTRRDFSHGCIRVQDPTKLAEWVLAEQTEWTREKIEAAMNAENQKVVTLKKPIPVYIYYSTVMADKDGRVSFYQDIYGHDQTLQALLAKGFPYPA